VCGSVLQCVSVCCSVLQCVVVCCSVSQSLPGSIAERPFMLRLNLLHRMTTELTFENVHHALRACCSVLQDVAVCCSVLQCIAVYCSVLQCIAVCCSVFTKRYKVLYCRAATRYNILQHTATHRSWLFVDSGLRLPGTWTGHQIRHQTKNNWRNCRYATMQYNATHCNALQHTATCCNTLQHTVHSYYEAL